MSDAAWCASSVQPMPDPYRKPPIEAEAAVREFVEWVATQKAFNGSDRAGQALYDYGLNVVLPAWAEEWLTRDAD